jgi:DNA-directed RNA polymerase specialized sigma24 family protein
MIDERASLAERFEEHRARVRAVAYRMLGSVGILLDSVEDKTGDDIPNMTTFTVDNGARLVTT